jgi:hypothetical protein
LNKYVNIINVFIEHNVDLNKVKPTPDTKNYRTFDTLKQNQHRKFFRKTNFTNILYIPLRYKELQ